LISTIDIPDKFLQADMDEEVVHSCLHGRMAELMAQQSNTKFQASQGSIWNAM